ncbi:MAG: protein translocase subunit SecD [Coriobacteriales bacterium]|jgi:SecD/SecF fusion protein|nr:protein translocase subunit SecD [Coriobacteriales bacterium]
MADRRFKVKKRPSQKRPHIALLALLVVLAALAIFMFYPPATKIHQGLDVQGGLSVVLEGSKSDGSTVTAEDMNMAQQVVERRVNLLGASEATVQVQGGDQLLVQIPGLVDSAQALDVIGQVGDLKFVDVAKLPQDVQDNLNNGTYYSRSMLAANGNLATMTDLPVSAELFVASSDSSSSYVPWQESERTGFELLPASVYSNIFYAYAIYGLTDNLPFISTADQQFEPLRVDLSADDTAIIFSGANISSVSVARENETSAYYAVNITLDASGAIAFADITEQLYPTNGKVAIVLDGYVQSAPAVQSHITGGQVAITGSYTVDDANSLRTILQSGSLPVTLEAQSSQVVGPTLGQDSLRAGVLVAIIGLILVALYLLFFYRGLGILTAAAVGIFAILYLGVLATLSFFNQFSLSLAGIAGIVLSIGVAADSSILVLERFKEEVRMGRSVRAASITGVRHAIVTSIDADLVTLVSALALFFISIGAVKGFGLTLALGVICDIATMLIFKAPLIRLLAPGIIANNTGFWGLKEDEAAAQAAGELKRGVVHG